MSQQLSILEYFACKFLPLKILDADLRMVDVEVVWNQYFRVSRYEKEKANRPVRLPLRKTDG